MEEDNKVNYPRTQKELLILDQDLNCLPNHVDTFDSTGSHDTGLSITEGRVKKKKRAATGHVAGIGLDDVIKYFDHPIADASRKLKVGVTVLKKKCREFGIQRWPHRKIKSLDSLIQNLGDVANWQPEEGNKAAAVAVLKRQRMLELEKKIIEREPFTEIQRETKRFRQDVFKRRHRARALNNYNVAGIKR